MNRIINQEFGKYKLLEQIGTGGMAEVFKAKFTGEMGFEKLLVIKKVLPHLAAEDQWTQQFVDEARLAALLHHENIIHVYDFGSINGSWFIAMEYLAGQDLRTVIQKTGEEGQAMPQELALHITAKLCEGLDYAHGLTDMENTPLNIIHRDISPQNIYITYDGHVKIIDFGIAKTASKSSQTQTGTIKGKFSYMSPEQVSARPIDHRSDIFAVGLILYELLTGDKVFTGEIHEVLQKVASATFEPPDTYAHIPEKLCVIINKALAKDRDDRYRSCGEMLADIDDYIYDTGLRPGTRKLGDYLKTLFHEDYQNQHLHTLPTDDHSAFNDGNTVVMAESAPSFFKRFGQRAADFYGRFLLPAVRVMGRLPALVLTYGLLFPGKKAVDFSKFLVSVTRSGITRLKASAKWQQFKPLVKKHKKALIAGTIALTIGVGGLIKHTLDQNNIQTFLAKAQVCIEENRLTTPENDSAYYYYTKVLKIDDNNPQAEKGMDQTVEKSIQLADNLLTIFRHEKALAYINGGLLIEPDNETLLELKAIAEKNVSERIFGGFKNLFNGNDKTQSEDN